MHRSRGVIHRSRGVCGEAEMGHQILLAPFVAVIGAFAATTEVSFPAVKTRCQLTQGSIALAITTQITQIRVGWIDEEYFWVTVSVLVPLTFLVASRLWGKQRALEE